MKHIRRMAVVLMIVVGMAVSALIAGAVSPAQEVDESAGWCTWSIGNVYIAVPCGSGGGYGNFY